MNNLLFNILQRQKLERGAILRDTTIGRTVAPALKASLSKKLIKAVIGPRRSGKSSLVHQVLSSLSTEYAYINLEDEEIPVSISFSSIEQVLKKVYPNAHTYFLDEIQVFPRWEQLLNRLERSGVKLVVSGSNSKLLSSELASSLTGRHQVFEILPFSFAEYVQAHPRLEDRAETFKQYLQTGGFPDVVMNRVQSPNYLRELWDSIILKDVVQRYKIRSTVELKSLLSVLRDSVAARINYRSLERALQNRLSVATVAKFCSYAEGAYLCFFLQNFSFKSRERVNSEKKVYLIDNGFYTSMKVGGQEDLGKLLENFVFISLIRRGLKPNLDFFYYKSGTDREVDFVILEGATPSSLLQVCWSLGGQATLEREVRAISEAAGKLGLQSATIVTAFEKKSYSDRLVKIDVVPIQEFVGS